MSLDEIRSDGKAIAKQPEIVRLLNLHKEEIAKAMPRAISADRAARIAITAVKMNPALMDCNPRSVFAAVIQAAQMGLDVGVLGEAYLVPYGNACQLISGYQGLMKLCRNTGKVVDIYAHEVRERDTFDCTFGLNRELIHEPMKRHGFPAPEEDRGEITGFYAVAVLVDGTRTFWPMSISDVLKIRDNSKGYQSAKRRNKSHPWMTDFVPMGMKTAIRALCKWLPRSPELSLMMAMDDAADRDKSQNLDLDQVIAGEYTVASDIEGTNNGEIKVSPSTAELSGGHVDASHDEIHAVRRESEPKGEAPNQKDTQDTTSEPKPKRKRRSKAEIEADKAKEEENLKRADAFLNGEEDPPQQATTRNEDLEPLPSAEQDYGFE